MRTNISDELMNAINEKIHTDLMIHVLNNKLSKAESDGNKGFGKYINDTILTLINERKKLNVYLRNNGVKIYEPVDFNDTGDESDIIFVDYRYSVKVNGGYKEGTMRYWKDALKMRIKNRLNKYFDWK